jgi:predicted metal-dependent hydrolase
MERITENAKISFFGEKYEIKYSQRQFLKPKVVMGKSTITVFPSEDAKRHRTLLIDELRNQASEKIKRKVRYFADKYGFKIKKVAIKDTVSRWGSCSSDRNININWRLALAPTRVMDYVIIHELCHTKEMNHSPRFWALVESCMPDYQVYDHWLRSHGQGIILA